MHQTIEISQLYNFLGWGVDELADYRQALLYYEKALNIREKVLGKEHPTTKVIFDNLKTTYKKSGKPEPFEAWLEEELQTIINKDYQASDNKEVSL